MRLLPLSFFFLVVTSMTATAADPAPAPLPAPRTLSALAQERVAPVFMAYAEADKELAALPPPANDAERLLRLGHIDLVGRQVFSQIDFMSLPPEDGRAAVQAGQLEIERRDIENQKALKAMLPARGWFLTSEIGPQATAAAWQIVQHAINADIALVRGVVTAMQKLLDTNEVDKPNYAMLADRVSVVDGVRQQFGTQMICNDYKWMMYPIAEEAGVDARRKALGIDITVAQQIEQFATRSCPVARYAGPIPE